MNRISYRYCEYIPNLFEPAERFPFAILVASENEIALAGTDAKSFNLADSNPYGERAINNSFKIIWDRVLSVLHESTGSLTGHEAVNRVGNVTATNIYLSPVGTRETENTTLQDAMRNSAQILTVLEQHHVCLNGGLIQTQQAPVGAP